MLRRTLLASLVLAPTAFAARAQTPPQAPAPRPTPPPAPPAVHKVFDFRKPAAGAEFVAETAVYSEAAGFGYEPVDTPGPKLFSVALPEGNYRVTVDLGGQAASDTTVKAESRRLMLESIRTEAGRVRREVFVVNVRTPVLKPPPNNAPGFDRVYTNKWEEGSYTWDDKLTLEFSGPAPSIARIEIETIQVPTVFLAGDSTVTDQRWEPYGSWGQMLPRFFKPTVAIANHAESGETLKSFITGRRLDKIVGQIKAGDWLFIQFGHNDSQRSWPHTYVDPASTYREYLRAYIAEAKSRGATPVLVTQMERRRYDAAGKVTPSVGAYPDAMRAVAQETNTKLIDLNRMSIQFYEAMGPTDSAVAFAAGGRDITHTSSYGAYGLARCVVEGIRQTVPDLAAHLLPEPGRFDPSNPGMKGFSIMASRTKPAGLP
jgi:lysophospholipase L1-like esterase